MFHSSLVFVIITIFSFSCTAWKDLFHHADLTFVFTPSNNKFIDVDSDFPYFVAVRDDNPYTPLRHFVLNQSTFSANDPTNLTLYQTKYGYRIMEKSARPKAIFVSLIPFTSWEEKCYNLIQTSGRWFRQEFVFAHYHNYNDLLCLNWHVRTLGEVKLTLFQEGVPTFLFVPCLTCDIFKLSKIRWLSLPHIRQEWDAQNTDFHKYLAFMQMPIEGKCYINLEGLDKFIDFDFCSVAAISERRNVTLLHYSSDDMLNDRRSLGLVLFAGFEHDDSYAYNLHQIRMHTIHFITITNPPSPAGGVETFVTPFEPDTWWVLLATVISVAGFFTFSTYHEARTGAKTCLFLKTWTYLPRLMADNTITVSILFLGQNNDSRKGNMGFVIVIVWLFGNFVLMVNYYQGSIYSCFTVLFPPTTPRGLDELIDYNIPMIAMDSYDTFNGSRYTHLQDIVIPELISNANQNSSFFKLISKFQAKLLSINDNSVRAMYKKITRENSTRSHPMLTIFLFKDLFQSWTKFHKHLGNRHIVGASGASIFQVIFYTAGYNNLFSPYIAKDLRKLQESGLTQTWENLKSIHDTLRYKKLLSARGKYFRVVQDTLGNVKEPPIFPESTSVSLNLVLPAFGLCCGVVGFGLLGFVLENLKFLYNSRNNVVRLGA